MLINLGRVGKQWAGGVWGGVRSVPPGVQSWGKECIENVETIEGPELHTALITHSEKGSLCCEQFLTLMGLHWEAKKILKKAKKMSLFKVLHCAPWNSFLPRILLKSKDRTCNNDTPKVKYYKFDHFQRYFSVFPAVKNHVVFTVPITCTLAPWRDDII